MSQLTSASRPARIRAKDLILIAVFTLAINLGFVITSHLTGTERPWVNLDYAFALVLFAFGFANLGLMFSMFSLLGDTLVLAGQLFPFPRFTDLLYLLKFTALASTSHFFLISLAAAILAGKLASLYMLGKRIAPLSALLAFNILAAYAFLAIQFGSDESRAVTYRKLAIPGVASQLSALTSMRSSSFLSQFEGDGEALTRGPGGATQPWFDEIGSTSHDRLLLIVVESWGTTKNPDINSALLAPLRSLPAASFEAGNKSFHGFTISAELRELCKLTPAHFDLRDIQTGFENCLPNRLQAAGYSTAAMHGATSLMYDRRHWYPRVGLQKLTFFEDKAWPRRCYSFPGACDLDMLPELERFFSQSGKRFMYWLTLNTHAPYDLRDLRGSQFDCVHFGIKEGSETCRVLSLQAEFFRGLAEKLRSDTMRNVDVVIVGDHAPKLLNLLERDETFVPSLVPWIRIKPS